MLMKKNIFIINFLILGLLFSSDLFSQANIEIPGMESDLSLCRLRRTLEYRRDTEYAKGVEYGYPYMKAQIEIYKEVRTSGGDTDGDGVANMRKGYFLSDFYAMESKWLAARDLFRSFEKTSYNRGVVAGIDAAFSDKVDGTGAIP